MILPPPGEPSAFTLDYAGPIVSENRRLRWAPRARRLVPDPAYRAALDALTLCAAAAHRARPPILEPVLATLEVQLPPRMDSTAVVKPCLDALQRARVLRNDSQVRQLLLTRAGDSTSRQGRVLLQLYPLHIHAPFHPLEARDPARAAAVDADAHAKDA